MGAAEAYVEEYLEDKATALGWRCYKFTSPGRLAVPDRIVVGNSHTVFVECKAPGEKPRATQVRELRGLANRGAEVCCIDTREQADALIAYIKGEGPWIGQDWRRAR